MTQRPLSFASGDELAVRLEVSNEGSEPRSAAGIRLVRAGVPLVRSCVSVFRVGAFVPKQRPKMKVDLAAKSTTLATWSSEHGDSIVQRTVDLPRSVRAAGCAALEFIVSDPASPFSLGISGDGRQLGIALVEVAAETANEH